MSDEDQDIEAIPVPSITEFEAMVEVDDVMQRMHVSHGGPYWEDDSQQRAARARVLTWIAAKWVGGNARVVR